MRKESGFTLIEVMTVIAIFGIMAAIAVPNYFSWLPQMRLNGATRQVAGDLMSARMLAVKENVKVKVTWGGDKVSYTIAYPADAPTVTNTKTIDAYPGVTVSSNVGSVEFNPRGISTSAQTITMTGSDGTNKYIVISIAGRIDIRDVKPT